MELWELASVSKLCWKSPTHIERNKLPRIVVRIAGIAAAMLRCHTGTTTRVSDISRPGVLVFNPLATSIKHVEHFKNAENQIPGRAEVVTHVGDRLGWQHTQHIANDVSEVCLTKIPHNTKKMVCVLEAMCMPSVSRWQFIHRPRIPIIMWAKALKLKYLEFTSAIEETDKKKKLRRNIENASILHATLENINREYCLFSSTQWNRFGADWCHHRNARCRKHLQRNADAARADTSTFCTSQCMQILHWFRQHLCNAMDTKCAPIPSASALGFVFPLHASRRTRHRSRNTVPEAILCISHSAATMAISTPFEKW